MFTNILRAFRWLIVRLLCALELVAMMLLHLLLHVLIYHLLSAKGGPRDTAKTNEDQQRLYVAKPKDTNYIVKRIDKCPKVGYYFTREPAPNSIDPGPCYLCFCHSDQTALCWKRDNRRCNVESFHYHRVSKRDTSIAQNKVQKYNRARRSPGFADIFFRDASRDVFNRNTEDQQCKPYESSFSDDCPPADWCIGCTVCDCDPNGRWDCHILSFCPEEKKGKKKNNNGKSPRKVVKKKPLPKTSPAPKITSTKAKKTKPPIRRSSNNKKSTSAKRLVKSITTKKTNNKKQQKKKAPLRYQKVSPKTKSTKPVVIMKNIATHKPITIKSKKLQTLIKKHDNNTVILAQQVVKKMMDAVKQMVQREMKNVTRLVSGGRSELNKTKGDKNNKNPPKGANKRRGKRQNRKKRDVMAADFTTSASSSTIMTEPEEDRIESTVATKEINTTPIANTTSNVLDFNVESNTFRPIISSTESENEYYKYIVATEISPNVIPLEIKTPININAVQMNTTEKTKMNNINSNEINKIDTDVIDKTEINTLINNTVIYNLNETRNCELNKTENIERNKIDHLLQEPKTARDKSSVTKAITTEKAIVRLITVPSSATPSNIINYETGLDKMPDTLNYLTDYPPEAYELKINKWQQLKKVKLPGGKSRNVVKLIVNKTDTEDNKNKLRTRDIDRVTISKKYNIIKLLKHYKCPFLNTVVNENDTVIQSEKKINDVSNVLGKLLKVYNNTKATKQPKKMRKFSMIRYLKKIFYKIFKHKNSAGRFSRNHIIETICEHFGPCIKNINDKTLLRSKLAQLDHETMTILKTLKILKGLLKLLDGPAQTNENLHNQTNLRNDIQKLNSILKRNYTNEFKKPLTQTQLIQIEYIKKNTQDFIGSISKFTILLNQIIKILTKKDMSYTQVRNFMTTHSNKEPFQNLKRLLLKYNLVQNNFMKRMYELLNNYNDKTYEIPPVTRLQTTRDLNSTEQIEVLSRNIIKNLRKLKNLAHSMKYNGRSKREAKDDAVEYLLMLMEFLLKQNHPLDAAPDNDGIDLLIETIKNAPDIKTIRKKVLDSSPFSAVDTAPLRMSGRHSENSQSISEDSPSISDNPSSEDAGNLKIEYNEEMQPKADDPRDILDIADEDKDPFDRYQFDRRANEIPKGVSGVTSDIPTEQKLAENEFFNAINNVDTTMSSNSDMEPNFKENTINNVNARPSNIFDMNVDPVLTDSENNYNYNTGNTNIGASKNNDNVDVFHNDAGNSNKFGENIEAGIVEIGKNNMISNIFNDHTGNIFDDNTENRIMEFTKTDNNSTIFNDNIENVNMDFHKNNNNGHILNDSIETRNSDLGKTDISGNIFNDDTENKNTDQEKKHNNAKIFFNDVTENTNIDIDKNINNDKVFNDNSENKYIENDTNKNNAIMLVNDITDNMNIDDGKNNNSTNIFNEHPDEGNIDFGKKYNNGQTYSDDSNIADSNKKTMENSKNYNNISENFNNYNSIPENVNTYNSIPEIVNSYNSISENANNNNAISEGVTNDNSIPENINIFNSISENANNDNAVSEGVNHFNSIPENVNNLNSISEISNNYNNVREESNTNKPVVQEIIITTTDRGFAAQDAGVKKFQALYTADVDEDILPLTAAEMVTFKTSTEFAELKRKSKPKSIKKIDLTDSESSDKKSKLEWIVENFGREDNIYEEEKDHEEKRNNIDHSTTKMVTLMPVKTDTTVAYSKTDVSFVSNELDGKEKKKRPKINTEEVILKKQMDLLNSLDYGTERAEFDESDSKDGNTDERYSDTYSAYFV